MYHIVRRFADPNHPDEVIETGLSLEQAKEHCSDPDASSRTCSAQEGLLRTARYGPWFDSFEEE
jgi:hypothetical protein